MRGSNLNADDWNRIKDILYAKKAEVEENSYVAFKKGDKRSGERLETYLQILNELIKKI